MKLSPPTRPSDPATGPRASSLAVPRPAPASTPGAAAGAASTPPATPPESTQATSTDIAKSASTDIAKPASTRIAAPGSAQVAMPRTTPLAEAGGQATPMPVLLPPRAAMAPRRQPSRFQPRGPFAWFVLLVLLPTAMIAGYYAVYAADMYESQSQFLVRGRSGGSGGGGSPSAGLLGLFGGSAMRPGGEEAQAVAAFIDSTDAVLALRERIDLVEIWRRPEADAVAMLWWSQPEAERLLRYYRRRVTVEYDIETGLTTLRVLAFRPADARVIAEALLSLAEGLVNRFSARTSEDTLRVAHEEVQIAERRVTAAREAVTAFREREQALDPTASAAAAMQTINALEASLAQARAELQEKRAFMRPDNPQIHVLNNRIAALTQQVATERGRRTRGEETLTQLISAYERLQIEREFADRQLVSAISSLESARADAQRQQTFLMRVVEPNLPERALYPKSFFNTLTILVSLSVLYAIGWLLLAGAREHAS